MDALTPSESQIIRSLITRRCGLDSPFLKQLENAHVESRRMTGHGCYVDLRVTGNAYRVDEMNCEITGGYPTLLPPPADQVGFTLFIREGYLLFLEGYTFGNVTWPTDPIGDWLLTDVELVSDLKAT